MSETSPSSFRFCPYVQHGKSERPLVISLELQHCIVVSEQSPLHPHCSCFIHQQLHSCGRRKNITGGATWGRKHLARGSLWSCELQTHSRGKQGPSKGMSRLCKTGICLMMMLLQSWGCCLSCSGFPLSLCGIRPKPIPWTGAVVCRGMGRERGLCGSGGSLPVYR